MTASRPTPEARTYVYVLEVKSMSCRKITTLTVAPRLGLL